jgi:hypothetical protein
MVTFKLTNVYIFTLLSPVVSPAGIATGTQAQTSPSGKFCAMESFHFFFLVHFVLLLYCFDCFSVLKKVAAVLFSATLLLLADKEHTSLH